jgi:solute carrier family 35, member C2
MDQSRTNVEEYALVASQTDRRYEDDDGPLMSDGVHLASLKEKKRVWWRNAIINMLFIASWSANPTPAVLPSGADQMSDV